MNKKFVIKDLIQTAEDGKPFYYWSYASSGNWTKDIQNARFYDDYEQIEQALKNGEFDFGMYEIITVYK